MRRIKFGLLAFLILGFLEAHALTQVSVFLPNNFKLDSSDINFSVRVKNIQNSFLRLNFNTNCHFRFRVYKDNQLVYPLFWNQTCKSLSSNSIVLNGFADFEIPMQIPKNTLSPGKYLLVNTVNNVDLRQVLDFEVIKQPVLIAGYGQTCGGIQKIECDLGLYCDLKDKDSTQYGLCKVADLDPVGGLDSQKYSKLLTGKSKSLQSQKNLAVFNNLENQYVSYVDFYNTMYYLNPNKLYQSKSQKIITRGEALSNFVKIIFGNVNHNSLDGFIFTDTIFSIYRKEIDYAYANFLQPENSIYFKPNDFLESKDFKNWINSLQ